MKSYRNTRIEACKLKETVFGVELKVWETDLDFSGRPYPIEGGRIEIIAMDVIWKCYSKGGCDSRALQNACMLLKSLKRKGNDCYE